MTEFKIQIFGNVVACRTEAEIFLRVGDEETQVAIVVDTGNGLEAKILDAGLVSSNSNDFSAALTRASDILLMYVNRTGSEAPKGLTAQGLSLWLLEKADGTAMGRPIR